MLVGRTRSCAEDKFGGGWETKYSERPSATARTVTVMYWIETAAVAAVLVAAIALPPQTNSRRTTERKDAQARLLGVLPRVKPGGYGGVFLISTGTWQLANKTLRPHHTLIDNLRNLLLVDHVYRWIACTIHHDRQCPSMDTFPNLLQVDSSVYRLTLSPVFCYHNRQYSKGMLVKVRTLVYPGKIPGCVLVPDA